MKINDLEKLLGVKRSNIFYYEREGLVTPRREDNNYREYSEEDLRRLKAIIVLRKLGFTVEEIRELFGGERALSDILPENMGRLTAQAEELEAARRLCRDMERQGVTMESFDPDAWFDTIEAQERGGQRFLDILGDAANDANRSLTFIQRSLGMYGPVYASYILSEEGIRLRRPLKWYWTALTLCCLTALLTGLLIGSRTVRSTIVFYLAAGLMGTAALAFCGRHVIPGRTPRRALALTIAVTLAADLCLLPLFMWAGPRLDGMTNGRLGRTVDDPAVYIQTEIGGQPVDAWEDGDLMIVISSRGQAFQFRRTDDGNWAQYASDTPVDGVVYTVDAHGPRRYPSRVMLSDGAVVEPVYEARFAGGYMPLYAFDVSEGRAYAGIEYGVDAYGVIHFEIEEARYSGASDWTGGPRYNEPKAVVDGTQLMGTAAGADFLAVFQSWRASVWAAEPLSESGAATFGVSGDYALWAVYSVPSSLTVHPADSGSCAVEWNANQLSECVYLPEDADPCYIWQRQCGAEVTALLTAEEVTPELLREAAAAASEANVLTGSISRWAVTVPDQLRALGSRVFREINGAE